MKITLSSRPQKSAITAIFAFENEPSPLGLKGLEKLTASAREEGFKARPGQAVLVAPPSGNPSRRVLLIGLGDRKNFSLETLRRGAAQAARKATSSHQPFLCLVLPQVSGDVRGEIQAAAEGLLLADYRFDKYKLKKKDPPLLKDASLVLPKNQEMDARRGLRQAQIFSEAVRFVRDLVNEPPSDLTPRRFAEIAETLAGPAVSVQVFDKEKIEAMGMGALLGVNRGSAEPPAFIHLSYKPESPVRSVALVGKGITFDSGGLSLKPAEAMETMKMDMAGAATVLGVFKALPALRPQVEVHGIMALTENMPGGRAAKPGDIFRTMSGKTIEVLNTDAEGRLILADALTYAVRQKPDAIIDLATLTGACIIALGGLVAGAMGNNPELLKSIEQAAEKSGEKIWPLPLVQEYKEGLKSSVADIKNISSVRREGGAIVGGLFLEEFVENVPWAHLDIAGPAWTDKEFYYCSPGGTGFPVRTLLHWLIV